MSSRKNQFHALLYQMLRIRMIEEKIVALYPQQEIRCPVHLCIGQEAIAAGVIAQLKKSDIVLSNHRSHGHYLAKGGDLEKFFAELYGKSSGCSKGRGGSMHLIDLSVNFFGSTPIVAGTIPVATGVAFGEKRLKQKGVTVIFFGDAAVEEGIFHESVNFAALEKLPIIYVCENNLYSVYTHLSDRQPQREIFSLIAGHGIQSFQADGNDIMEVCRATQKALRLIQKKKGPVFIEFLTYRWREHCGPNFDNDIGYRAPSEFKCWQKQCPIVRFKKYLQSKRLLSKEDCVAMEQVIASEIEDAVKKAKSSPNPDRVSQNDVYCSTPNS